MILSDNTIKELILNEGMILNPDGSTPPLKTVRENEVGGKAISHGISPYGYDVTLAPQIRRFGLPDMGLIDGDGNLKAVLNDEVKEPTIIDPKKFNEKLMVTDDDFKVDEDGSKYFILQPGEFVLGVTNEVVNIPNGVSALCVTKSTYARIACKIMVTPINSGFQGPVVIEILNNAPHATKLYVNEGIAQFMFFEGDSLADELYSGPYQGQKGIQPSKV